jgi:hypothetical protein
MKKFFFLASFVVFTLAAQAKIWRVNNNPGVAANFTTLQAAHDGAAAGDTIHIEPSPTVYGDVNCSKRLTWLSIGAFLTENPGIQYSTIAAIVGTLYINAGSAGSIISVNSDGYIYIYTDNISVLRSKALYIFSSSTNAFNTIISQCFISGYIGISGPNSIVTNNICTFINTESTATGVIAGNILTNVSGTIYNSVFQNNIILGGSYSFINSNISYNMTSEATGLPAGNGNILNVNMASVFLNPGDLGSSADKDFKIKPGSPAIGAGQGGSDMGAFGGSTPFVLGLQPAIPAVTAITSPAASNASSINVTFSAKSNQ